MPDVNENRRILFSTLLNIDYHTPVNHEGIYAQAYALYRQGFQYWYENQEITFLNNRNEAFRQKDPVEENLFFYFRAARQNDIQAQWYPASYLLSVLSMNGRTQANTQTKQMLVTVLESNHFHSRRPPTTSRNIGWWSIRPKSAKKIQYARSFRCRRGWSCSFSADFQIAVFPRNGSFPPDSRFCTK